MFRRARLSVKPNVRPGGGARGSAAPNAPRGPEAPRPPEPAAEPAPKPAEPTDVPAADPGGAEPHQAPGSSDAKTDENNVGESSKPSSAVSQRRKRVPSTSGVAKPTVSAPSQCHPLSTVNHDAPQPSPAPAKEKQPCSDRYRIYKARKLREMLKEELRKEKKQWKNKFATNESQRPPDRSKMTMRDFIYYLPDSNPMTSSVEQEKKTEKSLTPTPTREQEQNQSTHDADDNEEAEEEVDDGPLLVPRVKVAEDGSIILDEESLTVEVLRTKGPCVVEENDPIFERGSTTTYSSFRKNYYSKPWSNKETDMFFLAISMVGTDFSMIGQLFPHRARIEIKNKFKREEKTNGWRIDKAFQEKRPFDFDFFAHLLQKVLAEEEKRKQKSTKSQSIKEKACKSRKNTKAKKVTSEEVTDDPDESVHSNSSDPERSQRDARTVDAEDSLPAAGQEEEQDENQEERRGKNQGEANAQEAASVLGNVPVQSSPPEAEIHINTRPEESEDECDQQQIPSITRNIDDVAGLASSEKVAMRTDPVPSTCDHEDMPPARECSESDITDLPVPAVGSAASCEVNNAENACSEEGRADLKSKSPETEQAENVKPKSRSRLQRPNPNLSRAVGKKSVVPQDKQQAGRSKNLPSETSDEKNHMDKERMNVYENIGTANTERENPVTETASDTQESDEANKRKQAPVLKTRFQKPKPKPNTGRRRVPSKERGPEGSPVSGEMTQTLEGVARPDTLPREKVPDVTVATLTATPSAEELESDLKGTGRNDTSSNMKMSEMTDVTVEMEVGLETIGQERSPGEMGAEMTDTAMEAATGLKASLNEISPIEKVPELIDTTEEIYTNLEETGRRETFPQENGPKEVSPVSEMETSSHETGTEWPSRERTPEVIGSTEEREACSEETEGEVSVPMKDPEEAKTMGEEIGGEAWEREEAGGAPVVQPASGMHTGDSAGREEAGEGLSAEEEKELEPKETGKRDISSTAMVSGEVTAVEETNEDLKGTGRAISVSWEKGSGEICVGEEMVADLEKAEEIDVSPEEHEPEEHPSKQPEADVILSSSNHSSTGPSLDRNNISRKVPGMPPFVEEKESTDKEISSHPSHVESSSQHPEPHGTDQGIQLADVSEQLSDTHLSKSLPQEQKPLEVKPAPFLRSRFKKPKPNLSRAALKRATTEAEHCVPGKKSEADRVEIVVLEQGSAHAGTLALRHNVPFLLASRENDESDHKEGEAVTPPCAQTGKDPSPPCSCEPREGSQSSHNQENDLIIPVGTQKMNMVTQETKQSVVQSTLPVRGRLQRPKPNVQKARQRQIVEKGEAEGLTKNEGTELQKDEAKTSLAMENSQIESEVEVVASRVSECRVNESQSHVVSVENLNINRTNVLDGKTRHENKTFVPSPAQLIRRRFQKAKPNLGGAHHKTEQPGEEKNTMDWSPAPKPDDMLQKGDCDVQPPLKEKMEVLTPLEVSARKDCVGSEKSGSARNDAQLKAGLLGAGEEASEDHPASSLGFEEQGLRKQTSRPQLLKESNYSKTAPHRRTAFSSASECEIDHSGKRTHRKMKPNVTKGRGSKRIRGKTAKKEPRASKSVLVTLRASQKEDEDDAEDFDSDYEEETCHLAPEELNKAPVFVPVGLRSPEPVSAQIEETMEELEISMDAADAACVAVVEHQLSHTGAAAPGAHPECLHPSSLEMAIVEQTQEEPGPGDGSTEAAVTLLTMGDVVLQSEVLTAQGDVGLCVFPDVHSEDKSHVPFSPDNVNHRIVDEYQEVSSPVISMSPASFDENKIVSKEQSTREEAAVKEDVMENALSIRNTASTVTKHLRMESKVVTSKPNSEKILGISEFDGHQEVANFCATKGTEVEIQRETEENDSKAIELEDKSLEPVTTAETEEQNQLPCVHDTEGTNVSQEANLRARNEDQEENLEEVEMSGAAVASSEVGLHTLDPGQGFGESLAKEPLGEDSNSSGVLVLHVPESAPSSIPAVQQENRLTPQDWQSAPSTIPGVQPEITVNLFANLQQDGEDEQAFILTLVEIPANATEGFTDASMQSVPSSLLPAPILVRSGNTVERGDLSGSLQGTSVVQDATGLSSSGSGDSEKLPANLDLTSRKRFRCSTDEGIHIPPAKKSSLTLGANHQECASEVCSEELSVFERTEESCTGQGVFLTSENTHTTPKPQTENSEPTSQCTGSRSLDEIKDARVEKTTTQLPQDEMVSKKEEKTDPASNSEQRTRITSSSKPLSRPGRRPLGFLSLICPKNSLDSDEAAQTHSKKRLKPHIPVSRRNLKKANLLNASQEKNESSDPVPPPSVPEAQSESTASSAGVPEAPSESTANSAGVPEAPSQSSASSASVPEAPSQSSASSASVPEAPSQSTANSAGVPKAPSQSIASSAQVSSDQPSPKEEGKNGPKRASEEEATTVAEFFLNDIFIEVDEIE